jgi:predicted AlkP superfamily pyrophosphatase or phosphodiesterase
MAIFVQPPCASLTTRYVSRPLLQFSTLFAACWFCALTAATPLSNESRHVVVVVWDGMRPDFVSEQNTPALWKLSREGVTFRNHHSVYPSATMVNGTALVTGIYPGKNSIIANHVYRPEINPHQAIDVELPPVVKKGDELSGGKYISVPTIAELVQRAGRRTAIAAAKTVGLLLDRQANHASQLTNSNKAASPLIEGERMKVRGSTPPGSEEKETLTPPSPSRRERRTNSAKKAEGDSEAANNSITFFAGNSFPAEVLASITEKLGAFPPEHLQRDSWTTKALTDVLWKDDVPALSILWLGEPDLTQHELAPGAPAALAAIKSADENLTAVLSALDQSRSGGTRETTDVFVVSDHGFSTIERSIDLRKILNDASFTVKTEFNDQPKPEDIMLAGNGGSVLFYVVGHNQTLIRRLVEFLQRSDFAGVIFTKEPMEGTFSLDRAMIHPPSPGYSAASSDHAPDVVMAFRWNDSKNQFGVPGMIDADWQRAAGKGTHATLSRFDMHNTLIAAGPDFRRGRTDDLPTGNIDLAPTILRILGIKPAQRLDGRILSEAMVNVDPATTGPKSETKTIDAVKDFPSGTWRQSVRMSRVGSTIYLDEGNGQFSLK